MAKERKRLINEDMVSEIPPAMHHPVPSVTASVHHRRLGIQSYDAAVRLEAFDGLIEQLLVVSILLFILQFLRQIYY